MTRLERLRLHDQIADVYFGPLAHTPESDPYKREHELFEFRDYLTAERRFEMWRLHHEQEKAA